MKIAAIVGDRPNFVKIAPIVAELRTRLEASTTLIHTDQHYDGPMSDAFFANLELPDPDVNLQVKASSAVTQIAEIHAAPRTRAGGGPPKGPRTWPLALSLRRSIWNNIHLRLSAVLGGAVQTGYIGNTSNREHG